MRRRVEVVRVGFDLVKERKGEMRMICLCVVLLVAGVSTAAPPEIIGPDKVYGEVGDWVEVPVQTTGKWVRYKSLDTHLKIFPAEKLKDQKVVLVTSTKPGRYKLLAYTGNDEGGSDVIITVRFGKGDDNDIVPPIPVPPEPPIPVPPVPPNPPIPVPPVPVVLDGAWVIVVEETAQRTPAIAVVLGD